MKNSLWMSGAHGCRLFLQAGYFVLLTRSLGPEGFGLFAAALSLVNIFIPFSSWGSGNILVMRVSRDNCLFPAYWGNALLLTLVTGVVLVPLVLLTGNLFSPSGADLFIAVVFYTAVGEILFYRISEIAGQAFQAFEQLDNTARLMTAVSGLRFLAAVGFLLGVADHSVLTWSKCYLAANITIGGLAFALICKVKGWPRFSWSLAKTNFAEGFFFSFGLTAKSIYTDCDKILLARMSFLSAAGYYAVAYSVISFVFTPVHALLSASYPLFFKAGAQGGVGETFALSKKLLPLPVAYGLLAAAGLYVCAPIIPLFLGEKFSGVVEIVRWLSIVPALQAVHYLLADALTGAGLQKLRSVGQAVTAGLNVVLNLILIPVYSWRGAAFATLVSEAGLALFLFVTIVTVIKRQHAQTSIPAAP